MTLSPSSDFDEDNHANPSDPTDKDHRAALAEIEKLWGASLGTSEGDKLDILVTLVERYGRERRWPLRAGAALTRVV